MPVLPTHDPLNVPATHEQINAMRDLLEGAPVYVGEILIDIDERSEKRLQDAIELWDDLEVETLDWTMGDNSVIAVTKEDLIYLLNEAKIARGVRALQLHNITRQMKASGTTTLRDLENLKEQFTPV